MSEPAGAQISFNTKVLSAFATERDAAALFFALPVDWVPAVHAKYGSAMTPGWTVEKFSEDLL